MIYYELHKQVWGGSPATEQIDGGIETVELEDVLDQSAAKDTTATTTTITTTTSSNSKSAQADSQVQAESEQDINSEKNNESYGESAHVPQDTIAKRR